MYPSISDFGRAQLANEQSQRGVYSQPGPQQWPPAQLQTLSQTSQNGPSASMTSASNFPMLRVHIADNLRTSPPVMISANQEDVPRAQFSYNFDYEHQVVRRLSNSDQAPGYTLGNSPPAALRLDPFESLWAHYSSTGYSREEIAVALAALGSRPEESQVSDFCKNCGELRSMGFDLPTVVGALVLHKSDLAAATDACLSSQ